MSGELLKFLASVVAVPAIVAAAYQLGFRNAGRLADENEAEELFQLAPGGFDPAKIGVDSHGAAAIARDPEGRLAVLVPHGNQFAFRLLAPGAAIIADKGKVIIPGLANLQIDLGEESKGWATIDTDANSA